jgi:outer membrane protein TolC
MREVCVPMGAERRAANGKERIGPGAHLAQISHLLGTVKLRSLLEACVLIGAVSAIAPCTAHAEEGPSLVVGRIEATRLGALHGPGVLLAEAPRDAIIEARSAATGLPRPPALTLSAGYRAGVITPGPEVAVTIIQDVALRPLGDARVRSADAMHTAWEADVARARLEAATRAGLAWVGASEAHELVRLRQAALDQAQALASVVHARVDAGVALPHERALADADVGAAKAGVLDAEGMQVEALSELRFALGTEPAAPIEAGGDLYATDDTPIDEAAAIRNAQARHPALLAAGGRARVSAAEVDVASATLGPALGFGASYVREGTGDQVAMGIVSLPIPFIDSARFEAARQKTNARVAQAQVERVRAELARDVRLAIHDREHWRQVRDALRGGALAPTTEAVRLARAQYEAGTHDVTAVLIARQKLVSTQEWLAHAAAEVQRADIRFASASGTLSFASRSK